MPQPVSLELLNGERISSYILRGRFECEGGVYLHVLGGEAMCPYWVENPVLAEARPPALTEMDIVEELQPTTTAVRGF